jgi:hypothetical protein
MALRIPKLQPKPNITRKERYGVWWSITKDDLSIEMDVILTGGSWKNAKTGKICGNGLPFHWRRAIELIWPEIVWHDWNKMIIEAYLAHRTTIIIGPASSGKTNTAALIGLLNYYLNPSSSTTLVCSTTREMLENRIWGEMKRLHRKAIEKYRWLPGHLIESRQRIVTDDRDETDEGRDFRNGLCGIPVKKGGEYVGLGDFVGIKNKIVTLIGDELHLIPRVFVDALANLDKNPSLKVMGLGNPKETTDALGVLAEPSAAIGGWESNIDQVAKSKVWSTRRPQGCCVQLVGSESPNLDGKLGIPLITQEQIDRDIQFYGRDSIQYTMMNQGMMPRGQGSRRVITRQMCEKFGARNEPRWNNQARTKIAFLDAAYRGIGGDRCVFGTLEFGEEAVAIEDLGSHIVSAIINQNKDAPSKRQIIALTSMEIVPINVQLGELPEDQIVSFVSGRCTQQNIPPENFYYDAGMRSSLVSAFARLWSANVCPIDCGGKPTERRVSGDIDVSCRDYYSKFVTELWFSVRMVIESGQFRGMTEEVMMEGSAREWKMVGANKHEVETKEEMKLKTGRSPDLFDALSIGMEGARQRGFVIRRMHNEKRRITDDAWKKELRRQAALLWSSKELNYAA